MKNKSIISLLIFVLGLSFTSSSCSDMLTPDLTRYNGVGANTDTLYRYWGILKGVQNIAERYVILGESRSDLAVPTAYTSDSVSTIMNFENPADGSNMFLRAADYYYVINQCNSYLESTDSATTKNGVKYMQREYAQVMAIRAWTYLQLVQNYGEVPFVTQFVEDASTSASLMQSATKANKDNLVDLLIGAGLKEALNMQNEYGYINYGDYSTGSASAKIPSKSCIFPIDAVLGDLYLLKGDYVNAATYYYEFMKYNASYFNPKAYGCSVFEITSNGSTSYIISSGSSSYGTLFNLYSDGKSGGKRDAASTNTSLYDCVTQVPSAANSTFGTVLTRVPNLFGFTTSSRQNTESSTNTDGTTTTTTTGSITVVADETYRQIAPSENYIALSSDQSFSLFTSDDNGNSLVKYATDFGDARIKIVAPQVNIDGDRYRFIGKACMSGSIRSNYAYASDFYMHYAIPFYRKALVYLRYAEAINRAGFPQHAFALLRDGLSENTLPLWEEVQHAVDPNVYEISANGDTLKLNGEDWYSGMPEKPLEYSTYHVSSNINPQYAYYVDSIEGMKAQETPYMMYHDVAQFDKNITGIHSRGCGAISGTQDTVYTYNKMVASHIAKERVRQNPSLNEEDVYNSLFKTIEHTSATGVVTKTQILDPALSQTEIQNAVENIIVDELALETCFEGNRYPDLMRIAGHKNQAGSDGTEWMAWKIARRTNSTSDAPSLINEPAIYNKLKAGDWYLPFAKK